VLQTSATAFQLKHKQITLTSLRCDNISMTAINIFIPMKTERVVHTKVLATRPTLSACSANQTVFGGVRLLTAVNSIPCGFPIFSNLPVQRMKIQCPQKLQFFCARARQPPGSQGPPNSRGFYITHNDAPKSVGFLWTSDQFVAETSTWQHTTLTTNINAPVGFEPTISAGDRPQSYASDRAATGTGNYKH